MHFDVVWQNTLHVIQMWNVARTWVFLWLKPISTAITDSNNSSCVPAWLHLKYPVTLCLYKENSIKNQSHSVLVCHLVQAMFTYIHCMRNQAACKQHVHRFLPSCYHRLFPKHCSNTLPLFLHTGLFHRQVASHHSLSKLQEWKNSLHRTCRFGVKLFTYFENLLSSAAM